MQLHAGNLDQDVRRTRTLVPKLSPQAEWAPLSDFGPAARARRREAAHGRISSPDLSQVLGNADACRAGPRRFIGAGAFSFVGSASTTKMRTMDGVSRLAKLALRQPEPRRRTLVRSLPPGRAARFRRRNGVGNAQRAPFRMPRQPARDHPPGVPR